MYFSLTQASQILGFRVERLRDWVNLGYIRPDIEAAGRGSKNLFTKWDLYRIKLFDYLVNHGLSREEACMRCDEFNKFLNIEKKALDEIKEAGQASALVVHGAKTVVADAARKTSERVFSLRLRYLMICKNKGIHHSKVFFDGEEININPSDDIDEINIFNIRNLMDQVDDSLKKLDY
ncbi:MAG TPA: MerR family transcriptional regulator [Desulfobacterales bacterium]|nr:MerR family transcriptional regulator [Desulfobacterales bacterium]